MFWSDSSQNSPRPQQPIKLSSATQKAEICIARTEVPLLCLAGWWFVSASIWNLAASRLTSVLLATWQLSSKIFSTTIKTHCVSKLHPLLSVLWLSWAGGLLEEWTNAGIPRFRNTALAGLLSVADVVVWFTHILVPAWRITAWADVHKPMCHEHHLSTTTTTVVKIS